MRGARRGLQLLGRRLPQVDGTLAVHGPEAEVIIERDRFGVPHVTAGSERDAWFGLGFCQGQDRAFQLEGLLRVGRGTLAALVGREGLAVDRLSRRIGFRRAAEAQLAVLADDVLAHAEAYAAGINAAAAATPRRCHELVLLRGRRCAWDAADVLAFSKLFAFLLASNWDSELARLQILRADGPEALRALHALYPPTGPVTAPPGALAGSAVDRLDGELRRFLALTGAGGGSNNWAVAPSRTSSGRPLLANDPHLAPTVPPHFYLADLRCPQWHAVGASLVGCFGIFSGHNEHAAWGVTAGFVDNTDLCVEEIGPDGASVRRGAGFVPCEVREERIEVKRGEPVYERVLVTPEGPVIGPALDGEVGAVSIRATWLQPRPLRGLLELVRLRSAQDFVTRLADFPTSSQNLVFATVDGHIGWQLVGEPPQRRSGFGALPVSGADPDAGWEDIVGFDRLPRAVDPDCGWIATANNQPTVDGDGPFLSVDYMDPYRVTRIGEVLGGRADWDAAGMAQLQLDVVSLPWRELAELVLAAPVSTPDARTAVDLLRGWDGRVSADSAAAAVFELFAAGLARRVARAAAPNSAEWAMGRSFTSLLAANVLPARLVSRLVELLRTQPPGWFTQSWPEVVADALDAAVALLRERLGPDPAGWSWGAFRPLRLPHPLSRGRLLSAIFDIPARPGAGDGSTVAQAAVDLCDPAANTYFTAGLRMVLDVGDWSNCRWALPGGQSGNPLSPHYDDQVEAWSSGRGIPIAWDEAQLRRTAEHRLQLLPA
jgi:penicillin amidase